MINIMCLKWGDKYGPEYVNRLYGMISRNTTRSFKFWCFTDDRTGIRSEVVISPLPRASEFAGWWNKIWLFSPEMPIAAGSQIFYIDLDTLVVDNIDDILVAMNRPMIVLHDFLHGIAKTAGEVGSGLMSWRHGDYSMIWDKFYQDPQRVIKMAHPHGDQWWVQRCVPIRQYWQDLVPDQVLSFKVHCLDGLPPNARIICYHGRPSIPESAVNDGTVRGKNYQAQSWVKEHWRE